MLPEPAEQSKNGRSPFGRKAWFGPLLILIASVYFYVLTGSIDENTPPGQIGPAFWPRVILVLLMASCVLKTLESYLAFGKGIVDVSTESAPPDISRTKLFVMIGLILAVVPAMEFLGFAFANFIFLAFFIRVAGVRRLPSLILTSLLGTVFLLYVFGKVVYLPLPKGSWIFNDMTIFIYRLLHII